jgi:dUTP pyrophosphatase
MNNKIDVKIKKLTPDAKIPMYQSEGAAGFDIHAYIGEGEGENTIGYKEAIVLKPNERRLIGTALSFSIPIGYELQLRPRSGLAYKNGITLTNSPATIDSDYRGEVKVLLHNTSDVPFIVADNDRICQGVIAPVMQANFIDSDELDDTERGSGGFGHTGVNSN